MELTTTRQAQYLWPSWMLATRSTNGANANRSRRRRMWPAASCTRSNILGHGHQPRRRHTVPRDGEALALANALQQPNQVRLGFVDADRFHDGPLG